MQADTLRSLGFTQSEAEALRRISMTLHRWFERECNGEIQRDETTNRPYWHNTSHEPGSRDRRYPIANRETGAQKRLAAILSDRATRVAANRLPAPLILTSYIQTDPRGASLYLIRPGDVPEGADVSSYYSRGICVY